MRVCLITPYSPRQVSGVGQVVRNIGEGLSRMNQEFVILTRCMDDDGNERASFVELPYKKIRLIGGLILILAMAMTLLRQRRSIDILHLHSISSFTLATAFLGKLLGIPRVLTLHGRFPKSHERGLMKRKEEMTISLSSFITTVSRDTKDYYQLESARVILNGVDTQRFSPDPDVRRRMRERLNLTNTFVLLYVGRWVAHKGVFDLIRLTKQLIERGVRAKLILVGSGEEEKISHLASELGVIQEIILVGRVDDVVPYYRSSDLLVLFTSPLEGLPLTLLEAMSCGLPCLATSVSGITEVVKNGENGFLIPPGDKEALLKRTIDIATGAMNLNDVSRKARLTVVQMLSLEKMVEDYLQVYKIALMNRDRAP